MPSLEDDRLPLKGQPMTITEDPTTTAITPVVTPTINPDARSIELAQPGDPELGQLTELPGT